MAKAPQKNERSNGILSFERGINLATVINLSQLLTLVWFGSQFYTQVNANQVLTEKRFAEFADQRKTFNEQMTKMQEAQTTLIINLASTQKDITTQGVTLHEIGDILHAQDVRGKPNR